MPAYLPLFIDLSVRSIVIFGGGPVGERKARYFLPAKVTVISREFTPGLEAMGREGSIRLERADVTKEGLFSLIDGAFLVVAATGDPAIDNEIRRIAEGNNILVNSATGDSSVIVPSLIKKEQIMIAISTGGSSPALSKYLRLKLESAVGEDMEKMASLQEKVRKRLKETVDDQGRREKILWDIMEDPGVWKALAESPDIAYEAALKHIKERKYL
jgi:precorrin-2 dehydrogenase/sirohydrochlorin ferrochelatase